MQQGGVRSGALISVAAAPTDHVSEAPATLPGPGGPVTWRPLATRTLAQRRGRLEPSPDGSCVAPLPWWKIIMCSGAPVAPRVFQWLGPGPP